MVQISRHRNDEAASHPGFSSALRLPLYIVAMVTAAFAIGIHIGYEHGIGKTLSLLEAAEAEAAEQEKKDRSIPRSTSELLGELSKARARARRVLKSEYANYYGIVFDRMFLRRAFVTSEESRARLRRRIQIRVLEAQVDPDAGASFVWATGGDSAAAGHGNRLDQSYTAVMEDTARDAFASVGVRFVTRNRAMGNYASAPELSVCMESIYGSDLDVIGWDFGLADGGDFRRATLWANRAAVHPTRPVLMMMSSLGSGHWEQFTGLEGKGTGAVLMDDAALEILTQRLPDTTDASRGHDQLPPALRYFVCGGRREGTIPCDDPMQKFVCDVQDGAACKENKFNVDPACINERYQTNWNRGWKEHLLRGRLLGAFMIEMLNDALLELDALKHPPSNGEKTPVEPDSKDILDFLWNKEEVDKFLFESSPASFDVWQANEDAVSEITPQALFRKRGLCRTALVPSQHTLDGKAGKFHATSVDDTRNGTEDLPLLFDPRELHHCEGMHDDRKEFFQVKEGEGWLSIIVPSPDKLEASGKDNSFEGLVMVCFKSYSAEENLQALEGLDSMKLAHGNIVVEVNGAPVVGSKEIDGCHWLEGENGLRWDLAEGKFHLKFRVDEPNGYIRISSIAAL